MGCFKMLKCEVCKRRIEELTQEEAMEDLPGHGWSDWQTAHHIKCYDCATQYEEYETYYAGRIKRGYPGKVFQKFPDIQNPEHKEVECYSVSVKQVRKDNKKEVKAGCNADSHDDGIPPNNKLLGILPNEL
jgi:hypothetical protein